MSLLKPTPIELAISGGHISHGLITGIKQSIMRLDEIAAIWKDAEITATVNGFAIINYLTEIDESMFDDENAI